MSWLIQLDRNSCKDKTMLCRIHVMLHCLITFMIDFDYINETVYLTVTNDEPDRGITRI